MNVDILIVGYRAKNDLGEMLASIATSSSPGYRLTVHDNTEKNYPLTWLWNRFIEKSTREFIGLLNPDIIVGPGWDTEAEICFSRNPNCASVSPVSNTAAHREILPLAVPDRLNLSEIDRLTTRIRSFFNDRRFIFTKDHRMTPGHCFTFRREAWKKVGGFDERIPFAGNDYDFHTRIVQSGMEMAICTHAFSFHKGCASTKEAIALGLYDSAICCPKFNTPPSGASWETV